MTPRHPMAIAVVSIVAGAYGINPDMLWGTGERAGGSISEARQLVCWVLRHKMCWSYPDVGKAIGVDHTSVIIACKRTALKQELGHKAPSFILALKALDLEDLHSLMPDIATLRSQAAASVATARPKEVQANATGLSFVLRDQVSISSSDPESSSLLSSDQRPVSKRARGPKPRLRNVPESWQPNDGHRELAQTLGVDLEKQIQLFRDHEFKDPKSNFDAAFRTWLRRAHDYAPRQNHGTPPGLEQHNAHKQAAGAELARRLLLGGRRT